MLCIWCLRLASPSQSPLCSLRKISNSAWVLFFLPRNSALIRASAELFQPAPGQAVPKAESNYESKIWAGSGCKQNFPFNRGKVNSLPCCSQLCSPSCINQGGATGMGKRWALFLFICFPVEEFCTFISHLWPSVMVPDPKASLLFPATTGFEKLTLRAFTPHSNSISSRTLPEPGSPEIYPPSSLCLMGLL